jgi:hypothetical protein
LIIPDVSIQRPVRAERERAHRAADDRRRRAQIDRRFAVAAEGVADYPDLAADLRSRQIGGAIRPGQSIVEPEIEVGDDGVLLAVTDMSTPLLYTI